MELASSGMLTELALKPSVTEQRVEILAEEEVGIFKGSII